MEMWEARMLLPGLYLRHRDAWEANRLTAYVIAQSNSKRRLRAQDLVRFPWEKEAERERIAAQMEGVGEEYKKELRRGLEGFFAEKSEC
jgi:hypothetical protein